MRVHAAFLYVAIAALGYGQKPQPVSPEMLGFEAAPNGKLPGGWNGNPLDTISLDRAVVHSGQFALKLERTNESSEKFTSISLIIPVDFAGKQVELRGFLKTDSVSDFAGLWLREDGPGTMLALDNMHNRQLQGTTDWTEYSIILPLHPEAERLAFGVLAYGTGRVWADDLQLLIDGKPVWTVPKIEKTKTILDLDHEFDAGSNISLTELSNLQIDNLALLGKVWGFVKFHDSRVAAGQKHWDYELLRVLPAILSAKNRKSAQSVTVDWLDRLGTITSCGRCTSLVESDLHLRPDLVWLSDRALLGDVLTDRLQLIYHNRGSGAKHFFVSKRYGAQFDHELDYAKVHLPDPGFQILAVFRFWNNIEYWFPYRDVLGENWDQVLKEHLPRIALAKDGSAYQRELIALIARAHDTHANLWSSLQERPPVGECLVPVNIHFVEGRAVVTSIPRGHYGLAPPLQVGDEITTIDDVSVPDLVREWKPYFADSNEAAMRRDMGVVLTRGSCREDLRIGVRRDGHETAVNVGRISYREFPLEGTHDLPGPAFRLLSDEIAYLKLSSVKMADAASYVEQSAHVKGLVIDIRNYPSEFMVFALGSLLVDRETSFVRFTTPDLANPGAFYWEIPLRITPAKPHFEGKVVILVDEVTQSSAEYTTMAFRSASGAVVIGSMTAGADGNVSQFSLPGGLRSMISGIGVFYPDKRPTQRIGIVPDIEVKPTIAGIRANRDEVLEAGIRQILGPYAPQAEIEKMAKH